MSQSIPGPYQKLYPAVSMMQAAERGDCNDPAESLEWSMDRCVFAQGQMSPSVVVIGRVGIQEPRQVGFAEHHNMIGALPAV
jgi:hypothetical protein